MWRICIWFLNVKLCHEFEGNRKKIFTFEFEIFQLTILEDLLRNDARSLYEMQSWKNIVYEN